MNFYTAKQIAEKWNLSVQQIRKYCKDGRIKSAFQYEGQWLIPENAKAPDVEEEDRDLPLLKKLRYQMTRNNHYGIYEYIQVNLAYSSNRMASNRLTRKQVLEMYRTNRITPAFEPTKVDDIFEVANHFLCVRYVIENALTPLSVDIIKHIHHLLTYGTIGDKRRKVAVGAFRSKVAKWGVPPEKINRELTQLLQNYEKKVVNYEKKSVNYEELSVDYELLFQLLVMILDFHVSFEKIHPFDDYNGRVGRVLMLKECLRLGIDPFVIDDKHRSDYNRGITQWETDPEILQNTVRRARERFQNEYETIRLFQYHRDRTIL